jgi:hypothetical protein
MANALPAADVPVISAEAWTLGSEISRGAFGVLFAAELRGARGTAEVCAKVRLNVRGGRAL